MTVEFLCAFLETLTLGLDSSQYTFDQSIPRLKFRQILEDGRFQSFYGIHTPVDPVTTFVPVEWGYKRNDKFVGLMKICLKILISIK